MSAVAIQNKLVDKLGDNIAFGRYLAGKYGKDRMETTGGYASTPMNALLSAHDRDDNGEAIGVITIAGEIVDGKAGAGVAAGDRIADEIYEALDKDDLKALVVRVDSPGGSVTASEKIRLAIEEAKKRKLPVVVSMANLAASGGYWVSTPADVIFAETSTITGSIGIFGVIPSAEAGLGKLGINSDGVKQTPLAGEPDVMGGFSPDFDRFAQSMIENGYRDFLTRVAEARKKTPEQVDAIAQGRIWAGGTARQNGLVDRMGDIDDALAEAAKLAKLEKGNWHARYIDPKSTFANALLGDLVVKHQVASAPLDPFAMVAQKQRQLWQQAAHDMQMMSGARGMQARCLECAPAAGVQVRGSVASEGMLATLVRLLGA